jgi:hypothetical protein
LLKNRKETSDFFFFYFQIFIQTLHLFYTYIFSLC